MAIEEREVKDYIFKNNKAKKCKTLSRRVVFSRALHYESCVLKLYVLRVVFLSVCKLCS